MLGNKFRNRILKGEISNLEEYLFVFLISMLCMIVYIASDVFLPSLPEMREYFKTSYNLSQSVLSIFMITLACTQIFHGFIADIYGKRMILLIVLPLFLIATLGCIFSKNIYEIIFFRFFQAFGASACLVIGRSLFADIFEPYRAQRAFAILIPLVSLSPALAPAVGGLLASKFDWHASFIFVLIFAFIVYGFIYLFLPESKSAKIENKNINFKKIFLILYQMCTDLNFLRALISMLMASLSWWYFVAGAPVMFHKLKLTPEQIGLLYFPAVLPYILCAFLARKMLKNNKPEKIYEKGNKLLLVSSFIMPFFVVFYHLNIEIVIISTMFITFSNGFIISMAMTAGIGLYKNNTGLAAGLLGTFQLLTGALASFIVGFSGVNFSLNYFAWFVFFSVLICNIFYVLILLKKKIKRSYR